MKEINVNINAIAQHRKGISLAGSRLGMGCFRPVARETWPEFDKTKAEIVANGNAGLILNRSPRKLSIKHTEILSQKLDQDISGNTILVINEGLDSEFTVPVSDNIIVGQDDVKSAIEASLHGDNTKFLADPIEPVKIINAANRIEIANIDNIIAALTKQKQAIETEITKNTRLAQQYTEEVSASKAAADAKAGVKTTTGGIIVETSVEED